MKPLVSIIVPVYKVEKYLPRCLDSLSRQSLTDIEILLIDDASPDNCGKICDAYAAKDARITVIHNKINKGPSVGRNIGIEHATGNYVMFVDSDDWVHEDFCKAPYECAIHNQADLVMFGYQEITTISTNSTTQNKTTITVTEGHQSREEAIDITFTAYGMVVWNKLYHKKIFQGIRYPEGQRYEDTATTYKLVLQASQIYCLDKILYYYFCHPKSFTKRNQTASTIQEQFNVCWRQCTDLTARGFTSAQFELFKTNTALTYCIKAQPSFKDPCYDIAANVILNMNILPENLTGKRKLLVKIYQQCPKLFHWICRIFNKKVD